MKQKPWYEKGWWWIKLLIFVVSCWFIYVHINTEIRVAFRDGVKLSLQENPDEVAPYKIMKPAVQAIQKVVEARLKLFNNL